MSDTEGSLNASHGLLSALESIKVKANEAMRDKQIPADIYRLIMLNVRDMYGAIRTHVLYQEQVFVRQGGNFYTSKL